AYQGDDNPLVLSIDLSRAVRLAMEESVHFRINGPDSFEEWTSTWPYGSSPIRLGPGRRAFSIAMLHQMHCVESFRSALIHETISKRHLQHCFDSLRRAILCGSDLTLEAGDFTRRNFTKDTVGATHVCRDWDVVYRTVRENWASWLEYAHRHNMPGQSAVQSVCERH
ncbi:hypothetical protein DENSPDRAFT_780667, partial [Dentipellis sp. KUC8613]